MSRTIEVKGQRKTYEKKDSESTQRVSTSTNCPATLCNPHNIRVYTLYTLHQKKGSDFAVWKSPSTSNKIFCGSPSNFNHITWLSSLQAKMFSSGLQLLNGQKARHTLIQNCIRLPSGLWLWVLLLSAPPTSYTDLAWWCGCMELDCYLASGPALIVHLERVLNSEIKQSRKAVKFEISGTE